MPILGFKPLSALQVVSLASFLGLACSAGSTPAPQTKMGDMGKVSLALTVPGGFSLSSVSYVISGGPTAKSGTIDVSQSSTIRAVIGGLLAGPGYILDVSAMADASDACAGTAGPVTVDENATVSITVVLTCHRRQDTGSIAINGTVDVCPGVDSIVASPAEVLVGRDVTIVASAGPDESAVGFPLAYNWTGVTSSSGGTATFHCSAAGAFPVVLSVTNSNPACNPNAPAATVTLTVSCTGERRSGEDVTPPTLTAFSFDPTSIDTTSSEATVTVSMSMADDLSGISYGDVVFSSPSGGQVRSCNPEIPPAGTLSFATKCNVVFPPFGKGGAWTVSDVILSDVVGNTRRLGVSDLQAAGFPEALNVVSTQDVTPPTLTAFSINPTSIDTTSGEATVTVSMSMADDLSGISYGDVVFSSPSGGQVRSCNPEIPPAGTLSFATKCNVVFPPFGKGGAWTVSEVILSDVVGNTRRLGVSDLQAAGFPEALNVVSTQDVTPPTLTAFSINPTSIDTTSGEATVTVSMSMADDLSGISYGDVVFSSPSGDQVRSCNPEIQPAGTLSFATKCNVVFPAFGEGGAWTVSDVILSDVVGNTRRLGAADLQAADFSTSLNVNGGP